MKTMVEIPDKLYSKVRKLAAARHQHIGALITEGLQHLVMAQPALLRAAAPKKRGRRTAVSPPQAARWLSEWRVLGERSTVNEQTASASEIVSQMRR